MVMLFSGSADTLGALQAACLHCRLPGYSGFEDCVSLFLGLEKEHRMHSN
jgi:hypothetical protein